MQALVNTEAWSRTLIAERSPANYSLGSPPARCLQLGGEVVAVGAGEGGRKGEGVIEVGV